MDHYTNFREVLLQFMHFQENKLKNIICEMVDFCSSLSILYFNIWCSADKASVEAHPLSQYGVNQSLDLADRNRK